jgi:hypothetical protein
LVGLVDIGQRQTARLPIVVLGGEHGELPLDVAGAQLITDLVVDERLSVAGPVALPQRREGSRHHQLRAGRGTTANRNPLHLVLHEADAVGVWSRLIDI